MLIKQTNKKSFFEEFTGIEYEIIYKILFIFIKLHVSHSIHIDHAHGQIMKLLFTNSLIDFQSIFHRFNLCDEQLLKLPKIVSEYDQEIPQSQTADNLVAPRGRAAQPSRDTSKTN